MLETPHLAPSASPTEVQAADWLRRGRERILLEWTARCDRAISLRDFLARSLDELVGQLHDPDGVAQVEESSAPPDLSVPSLGELIQGCQLLRDVVIDFLQTEHRLPLEVQRKITGWADQTVRHAATRYSPQSESALRASLQHEKDLRSEVEYSLKELVLVESRLRATLSVAKVGFYDWDMIRDQIHFSDQMQQDWGLGPSGTLEKVMLYVHRDDRENVAQKVQHALATRTICHNEYRVVRPDGTEVWIEAQGQATYDDLGRATRFFGTSVNITERKRTQMALHNERHKLDSIVRESPAAIALWRGPEMIFEMVNSSYQKIFGTRQLVGKPLLEAVPELIGQPFFDLLLEVLKTGEPFVGTEVSAWIADDKGNPPEEHFYDFSYVRVCDSNGKPYGVYDHAVDVTERVMARRNMEEGRLRLQELVQELEQEREIRERFVATLTHDLRSPLAAARMSAQMICRDSAVPDGAVKHARRIVKGVDRTDRLIQQLLDVSRIQAGENLSVALIPLCLTDFVARYVDHLAETYGDQVRLGRADRVWVKASEEALSRLLDNLCSNAVKYGAKGRPVTIELVRGESTAALSVHNEGPPIGDSDRQRLFDPFKRAGQAETGNQEGWGLGLTIVRALATAHGGTVELESSEKCGTTFTVSLPNGEDTL